MLRVLPLTVLMFTSLSAPVSATDAVSFTNEVMAVLSRTGCNSGACHGNLNGKGGLRLSLRGESPNSDWKVLTRDMLGRRIDPANPDESLILLKATGRVPHEGGIRFGPNSREYQIVHDWIVGGAKRDPSDTPKPVSLTVSPIRKIVTEPETSVQLTVTATFSDGSERDVTGLAAYELNNVGVAKVLLTGEVVKEQDGEVVILVSYVGKQVPVRLSFIPNREEPDLSAFAKSGHPIDRHAAETFRELKITPAELSSDSEFLRRAYFDTLGMPPTAEEVRQFLNDSSTNKRAKLIDDLLERPEFAENWAQKWSDLLRNEEKTLDRKGVQLYYRWIKSAIEQDKPLNQFAAEILSARGSTYENPPANFYRAVRDPYQRAESVAQVFLGLRISCAKCHNHPFDVWTQDDYHRFVALFARIDYRIGDNDKRDRLDKHEFVGDQIVYTKPSGELPHPQGGNAVPKFLGVKTPDLSGRADRLDALADWVASPDNAFFAKAQANRVWFHLFGQGLVEPNDDFRLSNPPTDPALMDHLADQFTADGYKLKPMIRHVMTSRLYQLAPAAGEPEHFSHTLVRPLQAEQLLDAISAVLDVPVRFPGYPLGLRAGQVPAPPQSGRRGVETPATRFLKVFGKPDRLLTCECERSEDPGVFQAFQMLTGEVLTGMLKQSNNRIGRAIETKTPPVEFLDELYLSALARLPSEHEREKLLSYLECSADQRAAWEDIAWGLMNSKEFLLRR